MFLKNLNINLVFAVLVILIVLLAPNNKSEAVIIAAMTFIFFLCLHYSPKFTGGSFNFLNTFKLRFWSKKNDIPNLNEDTNKDSIPR